MLTKEQIQRCMDLDKYGKLETKKDVADFIRDSCSHKYYTAHKKNKEKISSSELVPGRHSRKGLTPEQIKQADKEYHRKWYQAHKAEQDAKHTEYMMNRAGEKVLKKADEYRKKYYQEHKEEFKQRRVEYYQANKDYFRQKSHEQYLRRIEGKYQ